MDIRQLRYFIAIAEAPSLSAAAHRLGVAQPSLSQHVARMETELGVRLIDRSPRGSMLTAEGHEVVEANDGMAGVEMANTRAFDMILMDISMPVLDGQAAARRIRAGNGPCVRTPILAVTAHALPEEIAQFRDAGMEYCISKPLDRGELLATLAAARGQAGDAGAQLDVPPELSPSMLDALLDTAHLERFWIDLPESARDALLRRFVEETQKDISWFVGRAADDPGLQARAHRVAGSCAAFGLKALRGHLGQIESALKQGQIVDPALIAALPDLWARSRTALDIWCDEARQTA